MTAGLIKKIETKTPSLGGRRAAENSVFSQSCVRFLFRFFTLDVQTFAVINSLVKYATLLTSISFGKIAWEIQKN